MSSLPDPHVLDAEADVLRKQAAALHQAGNDALKRDVEYARQWHRQHDPERQAEAQQAEAERAEAKTWAADAAKNRKMAETSDKAVQTAEAKGLISDAEEAREAAQRQRALADQEEATAKRIDASAGGHEARVHQLDQEGDDIWVKESNTIEKVADQIDEKVRFLSEAAQKQREADAMRDRGDDTGAAEAERAAGYFIQQADTRRIDVSAISPAILEAAGVQEDVLNRPQQEAEASPNETPQAPPAAPSPHPEDVPPAQVADADDPTGQDAIDAMTATSDSTMVAHADTGTVGADSASSDPFASADADTGSAEPDASSGSDASTFVADSQVDFGSDSQGGADFETSGTPDTEADSFESDSLA